MLKKTLLAAAMLLAGTAGAMADPVKIRVAWVVPVTNLPSILLEKPELMTHNGKTYQAELVRFQGTPPMITAMAVGELEIALLNSTALSLGVENAGYFRGGGGEQFALIPCLNDGDAGVRVIQAVVQRELMGWL